MTPSRPPSSFDAHLPIHLATREGTLELLYRLAHTAGPYGAMQLMKLFGRLAQDVLQARILDRPHWFKGEPQVFITPASTGVRVDVMADLCMGLRERVLPRIIFPIPFDDVLWVIESMTEVTGPLVPTLAAQAIVLELLPVPELGVTHDADTGELPLPSPLLVDPDATSPMPRITSQLLDESRDLADTRESMAFDPTSI